MPIHAISFAVPEEVIVPDVPAKDRVMSRVAPREMGGTCQYSDETEYHAEYRRSYFGATRRKAGWDCMRHYEILANGCIPYFEGLDRLPTSVMHDFPRELVRRGMELLPDPTAAIERLPVAALDDVIAALLLHTRARLTTRARALEIMREMGIEQGDVETVLFLGLDPLPDYLRCAALDGFKRLFGARCTAEVEVPHLYQDFPVELCPQLYGRGFTYARHLPPWTRAAPSLDPTESRIRRGDFDLVVYGSAHRGLPYLDVVTDHVDPGRVAFLCGEDTHDCPFIRAFANDRRHLFVRELE